MDKLLPALDYMESMDRRDHPDRKVRISPGIDHVVIQADSKGIILGPDAQGNCHEMTHEAYNQVAKILGLTDSVLRRAPPSETVGMVNYRLGQTNQPTLAYAIQGDKVVHWIDGGASVETTSSLLQSAVDALGTNIVDAQVAFAHDNINVTRFSIFNPHDRVVPVEGREFCFGISVRHSLSWIVALNMALYIHDPETGNGAIVGDHYGRYFRRRRLDGMDWWPRATMERVLSNKEQTYSNLQSLHGFKILDGSGLTKLVRSLFFDLQAPKDTRFRLQEKIIQNPPNTVLGVYDVVAGMGSDMDFDIIPTQRYKVLELAGNIVNNPDRCPHCFRGPI